MTSAAPQGLEEEELECPEQCRRNSCPLPSSRRGPQSPRRRMAGRTRALEAVGPGRFSLSHLGWF